MKTYDASMAQQFRAALILKAGQLGAALQADVHTAIDSPADELDDLKDLSERQTHLRLADAQAAHASEELEDVRAALARIGDGSYGRCIDCGDAIDLRRLAAMPTAARCASCEGAREHAAAAHR
jgi:DnaK suppressor protein